MSEMEVGAGAPDVVVLLNAETIGRGDDELGAILLRSFLKTLPGVAPRPRTVIFLNGAVKLVADGSALLDDLRRLEEAGVALLACGTCLDYFGLRERLRVGAVSNMHDIATALANADRVVSPS